MILSKMISSSCSLLEDGADQATSARWYPKVNSISPKNSNIPEFKNSRRITDLILGGETPLQGSHYFYEIFINDELKHSVLNKTPRTFENVKGEMANGLPLSVKGVFKNLSCSLTHFN